jgi:amidohydrolase family protein
MCCGRCMRADADQRQWGQMSPFFRVTLATLLTLALVGAAASAERAPLFDAHLHYNGDMRSELPPAAAVARFDAAGVRGIVANSTPNEGSFALARAVEGRAFAVVLFLRPYRSDADRGKWFNDPAIAELVDRELPKDSRILGVGEFHVHGAGDASRPVIRHIIEAAAARDLWLLAHCDEAALEAIFAHAPRAKVIWAHTGFTPTPPMIADYLARHPTLVAELSYRNDIATGSKVAPSWRDLFLRYPDRFVLGADTWTADRWQSYERIIDAYRDWLSDLPADVATKIRWDNAARMFGLPQVK